MRVEARGKVYTVVRFFVGLIFVFNGALGLIDPSLTTPENFYSEAGDQFITALWESGYLMYAVKVIETLVGVALIVNRFVALALVALAPVAVNIVAVNVLFSPSAAGAIPPMAVLVALLGYLAFTHRKSYRSLFRAKPGLEEVPDRTADTLGATRGREAHAK